jgi:5-methylcytosine-specific restriction endonuclease McrA
VQQVKSYSLTHISDQTLLRDLATLVIQDRSTTAALLAHIAEVDARRLYLPAGYPSMNAYCIQELRLSEDSAAKRIQAARAARRFPAIFAAVAEGRLHLSGACLLAPWLTAETCEQLLAAAAGRTKAEIERLVAEWFPQLDVPEGVHPIAAPVVERAPGHVEPQSMEHVPGHAGPPAGEHAPGHVGPSAPGRMGTPEPRPKVTPLSPGRFSLTLTMDQEMHDDLGYAQELLSHQIPSREVTKVLHRALKALIAKLERAKFGATDRPRQGPRRSNAKGRHIPAQVRRAVRERDQGQCTFVSESGHRCSSRSQLEFDHVNPVARGGESTVENLRLRCRAHNHYEAERAFGADFMRHKREEARARGAAQRARAAEAQRAAARERAEKEARAGTLAKATAEAEAEARVAAKQRAEAEARARAAAKERAEEVIPYLRRLGVRAADARLAAERCESIPEASLEERLRLALTCFGRRPVAPALAALGT